MGLQSVSDVDVDLDEPDDDEAELDADGDGEGARSNGVLDEQAEDEKHEGLGERKRERGSVRNSEDEHFSECTELPGISDGSLHDRWVYQSE